MASPYCYGVLMVLFASSLAWSHAKINIPTCNSLTTQPLEVFIKNSTQQALDQISKASLAFTVSGTLEQLIRITPNGQLVLSALDSCRQLLPMAINNLNNSLFTSLTSDEAIGDVKSLTCAAADDLQTCVDGFKDSFLKIKDLVASLLNIPMDSISTTSEALYEMSRCSEKDHFVEDYPSWISSENRELVETSNVIADVVVAKDGTGKYRTISEAVKAAPSNSDKRFVIHVKKGTYVEYVKIAYDQRNVMMFGDGMDTTIVVGNRSYAGGYDTFTSATFSVYGEGFIARDMGFYNTAGADKDQAVALLSTADKSVFYRCRMDSYQDTLFAKNNRQFYRECNIYGTIDFVFGYSAVVQSSNILVRRPAPGQGNSVTAQNGESQNCRGGLTIQTSHIKAADDLKGVDTFLGRTWKNYSTVVFMQNTMDSLINPLGWERMSPKEPVSTVFLAEYGNKGPGAATGGRVKWSKPNISAAEASKYTVSSLINGGQWLTSTGIPFTPGL